MAGKRLRRFGLRRAGIAGALSLLAAVAIWTAPAADAIANGRDVPDGKYTFSAALSMPLITRPDGTTYASACSGSLIAPSWIATAGHCLHDGGGTRISGPPAYEVRVTVGRATLSGSGGQTRQAVEVRQSPTVDFALVRLNSPINGITPLRLNRVAPRVGTVIRVAGWGSRDSTADLSHRPDRMQTGLARITSLTANHVRTRGFAPSPDTSACPYDSGAPYFRELLTSTVLISTEVGGPDCPHAQDETTARIDTIYSWIMTQLRS